MAFNTIIKGKTQRHEKLSEAKELLEQGGYKFQHALNGGSIMIFHSKADQLTASIVKTDGEGAIEKPTRQGRKKRPKK